MSSQGYKENLFQKNEHCCFLLKFDSNWQPVSGQSVEFYVKIEIAENQGEKNKHRYWVDIISSTDGLIQDMQWKRDNKIRGVPQSVRDKVRMEIMAEVGL